MSSSPSQEPSSSDNVEFPEDLTMSSTAPSDGCEADSTSNRTRTDSDHTIIASGNNEVDSTEALDMTASNTEGPESSGEGTEAVSTSTESKEVSDEADAQKEAPAEQDKEAEAAVVKDDAEKEVSEKNPKDTDDSENKKEDSKTADNKETEVESTTEKDTKKGEKPMESGDVEMKEDEEQKVISETVKIVDGGDEKMEVDEDKKTTEKKVDEKAEEIANKEAGDKTDEKTDDKSDDKTDNNTKVDSEQDAEDPSKSSKDGGKRKVTDEKEQSVDGEPSAKQAKTESDCEEDLKMGSDKKDEIVVKKEGLTPAALVLQKEVLAAMKVYQKYQDDKKIIQKLIKPNLSPYVFNVATKKLDESRTRVAAFAKRISDAVTEDEFKKLLDDLTLSNRRARRTQEIDNLLGTPY